MTWYKSGTVSVTQNSSAVLGAGTAFIANGRVGDAFRGPDGNWYEVVNIASDTALAISPNYQGPTTAGGVYALAPMEGYVKATADALREASRQVGDALDGLEESVQQAADSASAALGSKNAAATSEVNASASAGAALSSKNAAATSETNAAGSAAAALASKNAAAASETNAGASASAALASKNAAAVSETNAAASAATAATLGVGRGYIDGFRMTYVSANSVSFSSGSAYIPATAKNLLSASTITVSGLVLTANTMYHAYVYDNAGTPAVEVVTTAPVIYSGKARHKTGDTSRRYIGSVLSKAANTLMKFSHSDGRVSYGENLFGAPFLLVSGAVIVAQTVSCLTVVPVTASHLSCLFQNAATDSIARLGNPDLQAPVSSSAHSFFVLAGGSYYCDLPLSSTQSFQWRHDGAANALFNVFANGYLFER
ncbi:hypothetical protein [Pseudomonas glycinae]|uniref:hypothetical protein n=1 Tax=Pseudomonas glycinae TaxID=1785145 RepID=UPI001F44FC6F|nr:hypothetical protein [Pseudomonas glycinae]